MKITDKYIFFWGGVFSNWYKCKFVVDDITFNCSEQFFMYKKAMFFGDTETANKILQETEPKKHKDLGRLVKGFNKDIWDGVSFAIMEEAVYQKFRQNLIEANQLLRTGDKQLVEASPVDTIWGIGLHETNNLINDPTNWKGKNWLGQILVKVRERLRKDFNDKR